MLFRIIGGLVLLMGTFHSVGFAEEAAKSMDFNRFEQSTFLHEVHFRSSAKVVECQEGRKSHCQANMLRQELVEDEEIKFDSTVSYSVVRTSLGQQQRKYVTEPFLNIEIYVDRVHRNFEAEILEIFNQSLLLESEQDATPIVLECHCDDREPLAYSYILGHRWGGMVQASLHNIAGQTPDIELVNHGNAYGVCDGELGKCQEGSRLQATFKFLAIRESRSGCLIRLRLPIERIHRQTVFEAHPLFLQEIHIAGTNLKEMP